MSKEALLSAHKESGIPAFLSRLGDMERKAYRQAIERWETDGGAILDGDTKVSSGRYGKRRTRRTIARSE